MANYGYDITQEIIDEMERESAIRDPYLSGELSLDEELPMGTPVDCDDQWGREMVDRYGLEHICDLYEEVTGDRPKAESLESPRLGARYYLFDMLHDTSGELELNEMHRYLTQSRDEWDIADRHARSMECVKKLLEVHPYEEVDEARHRISRIDGSFILPNPIEDPLAYEVFQSRTTHGWFFDNSLHTFEPPEDACDHPETADMLRCPFCGFYGYAVLHDDDEDELPWWSADCCDCICSVGCESTKEAAIALWNTRK